MPLVVHAWRRAFNAAFLQKETPPDTHMVGQDEPRGMMERNLTVANGTFVTASTVVSAKDMRLTPPADAAHCMAKTREPRRDWGVEVARWVFGDEIGLPKRYARTHRSTLAGCRVCFMSRRLCLVQCFPD